MYFAKYFSEFEITPVVVTVDEKFASYPSKDFTFNDLVSDLEVHKTKTLEPLRFYSFLKSGKANKVVPQGNVGGNKKGILDKFATYIRANFFIPDARIGWNRYAYSKAKKLIEGEHFDFVITTGPPHSTHLIGLKLKKEFGIAWMADFRDPWTEVYYNTLFKRTFRNKKKDERMEYSVLENANLVLTVGPSMRDLLLKKVPNQASKFHFVYNGYDESKFKSLVKEANQVFTIRYVGTLTENYPYKAFVEALNLLEIETDLLQVEFIGNIEASVFDYIAKKMKFKVSNIPSVSHSEAIKFMKNADLLLLLLPFMKNSQIMLTGKIFEYLATKNPILCIGDYHSDASKIIQQLESSIVVDQFQVKEISQFIKFVFKNDLSPIQSSYDVSKFSRFETAKELSTLIHSY